jgi:hypothetical protein
MALGNGCNGEVLESALKLPETGPIGLEGDRGQMEYRRIRIQDPTSARRWRFMLASDSWQD